MDIQDRVREWTKPVDVEKIVHNWVSGRYE